MVFPNRNTNTLTGHIGAVHCVTYSAGAGQYALTGGADRKIYLWNPTTASRIQEYKLHGYEVLDITVTSDNSTFASVGGDKQAFLWDVSTAKTLRRFEGHLSRINSADFNQDGSVLATGSYDTNAMLWDTKSQSRKPIQVLEDAKDSVSSVHIVAHEILTGSVDGRIRNYDIRMGRCFVDVIGYPVTCVTQSSDGNAVLVSALDGGIRLMDKINGQMLQSYRGHLNTDYRVRSCFGDRDKYAITGSEDGQIWVYDLLEGTVVDKMEGHSGKAVTSVTYNPAGKKQMLSGGADGNVFVWGE
ncbi:uncharacterized protein LAJ45_09241 [Morchella importuna]|uniref:uncharacterized protein n=1 Tax=Morchella importuna TaxID=1174673 RepID=UPI001E8E7B6D|nr:uncharacterized protein LAJ45_09241 [Morchella importuna]KAH8146867.1 hypothetical protein LAJ45_09241 [Morchella importuna]